MSRFGDDLIQAMGEALAHAEGKGPVIVHVPVDPREIRTRAKGGFLARLQPCCG